MAFAALGRKEDSTSYLIEAANKERGHRLQARAEYQHRRSHDPETIETFNEHVSILQVLSEELGIPRRQLDASFTLDNNEDDLFLSPLDQAEEEDLWRCIQTFNSGGWSSEPVEVCEKCWATSPSAKLKKCSRCKDVSYCSRECQLEDWKAHKMDCGEKQPQPASTIGNNKIKGEVFPE